MGSTTGKRIAVVVKIDGQPLPVSVAGTDVAHDEGQSYLLVDEIRPYNIYKSPIDITAMVSIATRSNKLVCKEIIMRGEAT
jgi:hypothetical protein